MAARAVYFDGNTYLRHDGTLAGLPQSSPYGFVSYWYNGGTTDVGFVISVFIDSYSTPRGVPERCFQITHGVANDDYNNSYASLEIQNPYVSLEQSYQFFEASSPDPIPVDGKWHNIMFSWDSNATTIQFGLDGVVQDVNVLQGTYGSSSAGPFTMPYNDSATVFIVGADYHAFSGNPGAPQYPQDFFSGEIAEFFFLTGAYINIADPKVRAKFINPDGTAVRIASNGYDPFGGQGLLPQIYMSGGQTLFPTNFPNYSFTLVSATDTTPPSAFYVPSGSDPLQTATTDPFGNGPLDEAGGLPMALGDGPLGSPYTPKGAGPLNDTTGLPASIGSRPIPQ